MSGDHNQYQKPEYVDRRQWKYDPMTGNRLWQGLTDDEIKEILDCGRPNVVNIKKAEQKLKEKNT